jgi:hypothetical protein
MRSDTEVINIAEQEVCSWESIGKVAGKYLSQLLILERQTTDI